MKINFVPLLFAVAFDFRLFRSPLPLPLLARKLFFSHSPLDCSDSSRLAAKLEPSEHLRARTNNRNNNDTRRIAGRPLAGAGARCYSSWQMFVSPLAWLIRDRARAA